MEKPQNSFDLVLDEKALGELRNEAREILMSRGQKNEERGSLSADGGPAYVYSCQLPPKLIRELFVDDDEVLLSDKCQILYAPETILDDDMRLQDEIFMRIVTTIGREGEAEPLEIARTWSIGGQYGNPVAGTRDTEYSIGNYRISPNNLPRMDWSEMDEKDIQKLVEDMMVLQQPMNFDDAEKIRSVLAAIQRN